LFILKVSLLWWVHFSHRILKASRKKKTFSFKVKATFMSHLFQFTREKTM
jgi:hypothetical protein